MKLNAAARRKLSPEDFAIPPQRGRNGRYPIPDKSHAIAALARVDVDGTPEEKEQVRAAVRDRYPDLPSSHGDPGSDAGWASERVSESTTAEVSEYASDRRASGSSASGRTASGRATSGRTAGKTSGQQGKHQSKHRNKHRGKHTK